MARAATTTDAFNAVAEPRRREILDLLAGGERSVTELVESLGLSQPLVSKHLRVLREVGLVQVRDEGRQRFYRLDGRAAAVDRELAGPVRAGAVRALRPDGRRDPGTQGTGGRRWRRRPTPRRSRSRLTPRSSSPGSSTRPKHLVWKAYTTPDLIARWWGGSHGKVTSAEVDLRVGGTWRYVLAANEGFEVAFHGEYREISEPERLVTPRSTRARRRGWAWSRRRSPSPTGGPR